MARLVVLLGFLSSLAAVLGFRDPGAAPARGARFDYAAVHAAFLERREEVLELARLRRDLLFPPGEEEPEEAPDVPLVALDTPELERGSAAYARCVVCHGRAGEGKRSQNAPAIGGQYDWYVEGQLVEMRAGRRENRTMMPYIQRLTDQDVRDLAAYIARLPWPDGGE